MRTLKQLISAPCGPGLAAILLLAFIAVLAAGFAENGNCMLHGNDGAAWKVMLDAQATDRAPFSDSGVDPYQGDFDAYYPVFREYLLPSLLTMPFASGMPNTFVTYLIYAGFMLLAAYTFARTVGFDRPTALLGGFLLPLMSLPAIGYGPSLLFPLFALNPHISQIVSLSLLIVAAFWALDAKSVLARLALIPAPALCLVLAVLALAPYVSLIVPAAAVYGGASFFGQRRWRDNAARLIAGVLVVGVPISLGMLTYFRGVVGYTAFRVFSGDFEQLRSDVLYASTWFWAGPLGHFGPYVISLGIVGALWLIVFRTGRLRVLGIAHLIATALFYPAALFIVLFAESYHGPSPVYFETAFWPYSLLLCAVPPVAIARAILRTLSRWRLRPAQWVASYCGITGIVVALGLITGVDAWASQHSDYCAPSRFSPIRATAITEFLRREVALAPGEKFRGLVATIDGIPDQSTDWIAFYKHDLKLWQETGNEHRYNGLWAFGIPTLFQYFTLITPPYYLLLTEFLARPIDRQIRSVVVLSRIDPAMMQLWGVRYLVTDTGSDAGKEVAAIEPKGLPRLRVVELPDPNLGNYSPTEIRHIDDFHSGLTALHERGFDGRRVLVTDTELRSSLVPATNVALVYQKKGFHLSADSAGRSVVVLPVQYSHCWTVAGPGAAQLLRADLMQLGVAFYGHLDTQLEFHFGPIFAGRCRVEDIKDMERLKITQARPPLQSARQPR